MQFVCQNCGIRFGTEGQHDRHMNDSHISVVLVGQTPVYGTDAGFPCPECHIAQKDGKTLQIHLKESHNISSTLIRDRAPNEGGPSRIAESSRAPVQRNLARSISIASDVSMGLAGPSAGAQGIPVPRSGSIDVNALATALRQLEFEPPVDDDRFVWEDTDVSAAFHGFRLMVKAKLERKETLTYEGDVQHILALSSILLLKPDRTHPDLYKFLARDICGRLRAFMVVQAAQAINMDEHFSLLLKNKVDAILCKLNGGTRTMEGEGRPYSRLVALREITALMEGTEMTLVNKILKSIRNMVEMLPRDVDQKGPLEIEYITRHLHAILSPLFEDIDNDILFRWISVGDKEKQGTMWPDASINIMQSSALGPRLGCGEVKSQYQAQNSRLIGIDLVRLGYLAKDASDKNKAVARFAFFVVGDHVTFYILQRVQGQMYIMNEIEHITLPQELSDIHMFVSQISKITRVISAFKYVTNCGNHTYPQDPRTVTDQVLKEFTE